MQSLDALINHYGTDKAISGYSKSYEYLFNDIKNDVTSLLEIGIGSLDANVDGNFRQIIESDYNGVSYNHYKQGGSLRVWRDYFPNAQVAGIDIAEDCKFTEARICTYICDSTDKHACDKQLSTSMFDIIIDDGLHKAATQLQTLKNFFGRTRFGGLYIIEDLGGGWDEQKNMFLEYEEEVKNIIKDHEYWFDTNILVIKKNGSKRGQLGSITDFNNDDVLVTQEEPIGAIEKAGYEKPYNDSLAIALHYLGQNFKDIFVFQAGAMDGITFDDMRGYIDKYSWGGVFVEPIPEVYEKLKSNLSTRSNHIFENVAVADYDGTLEMMYVPDSKIQEYDLQLGYKGMATAFPPRNGFGSDYERDVFVKDNYSEKINVKCLTLDSILKNNNVEKIDVFLTDTEGMDWEIFKQLDLTKYRPKCIRVEHMNLFPEELSALKEKLEIGGYVYEIGSQDVEAIDIAFAKEIPENYDWKKQKSKLTVVTGLWNIGRPGRSFDHYLECFDKLLKVDVNMFIFIPRELEDFVWQRRSPSNTAIKYFELDDIKNMFGPFWDKAQEIRTSEDWLNRAGWLADSPQGSLEWYNPIVMSKMSLLHDASIYNTFDTDNLVWIDGGITNTVNYNLLIADRFFDKLEKYLDPFLFVQYPYPYYGQGVKEVHGFEWDALNRMAGGTVEWICRGGLFGGNKEAIKEVNSYYWHLLNDSLNEGLMGTEESLFSILAEKYPEICRSTRIGINGHIQEFVEKALDDTAELQPIPESRAKLQKKSVDVDKLKMSIYMLTFNFPYQVEHTIQTWLKHPKFITNTRNILIDNSTNEEARIENAKLCEKYGFEHIITNENTGINGGRFRAAKHFQESDSDYYLFLEDDMGIHPPEEIGFCRNGFRLCVDNLYDKILKIMHGGSDVDFLKLSFTEVYMDNNIQVSWYNIPQAVRTELYPDYDKLPEHGLDPNCPRTVFDKIEFVDGLGYITGDVYYANWPTICGKKGNQKMFLDTTWERPYEQTWMSYMFQETIKGNLKPAVLLASPVHHNRIAHYKPEERREN
jgi:FkbM family methyltransferase